VLKSGAEVRKCASWQCYNIVFIYLQIRNLAKLLIGVCVTVCSCICVLT